MVAPRLHFGSGDSVTFGSTDQGGLPSSIGFSKTALSNMQVGDLLVAWYGGQSTNNVVTAPSGWTRYGAAPGSPNVTYSRDSGLWYYPLTDQSAIDALPATITWSFNFSNSNRGGFVVARATGIDLSDVEDSAATQFSSNAASSTFAVDGITTINNNTLLVGGVFRHNSANTTVPVCTSFMSEFQEYDTTSSVHSTYASTSAIMGYTALTTSGATGAYTATFDKICTALGGELVAFKALDDTDSAAPYIVGTPTTYVTASKVTSFTIAAPTGIQDGDTLILALSAQTPTALSDFVCSGWQRISQPFVASSGAYRVIAFYALPVAVAADITQTSFTFSSTDSLQGGRIAAEMFIVRGAELSYLTDGYSAYGAYADSQSISVTQPNTTVSHDLILAAYNAQYTADIDYTIATGPAAMTQQNFIVSSTGAESKTTLAVYYRTVAQAGQVPAATLSWNGAVSQASGVSVAIRPLGTAPADSGLDIHYTSTTDILAKAKLFYTSATDTLATPKEIRPVPTGYSSVAVMLAQNPFYVAHRGGSNDWPEMSLHAYTQSAFWGVGAVELSLARTSDGVWFGLHDASLDRTSLGTGGGSGTTLVASAMTWAQVQQYQITTTALPQPYMRWEEIIAAYYPTHVIFVDPKYAASYTTELLNMMDALSDTPQNHFVAKSYGKTGNAANTNGFPHDAAARGYKNWGYFYEDDYANGNLAAYQGRYDILGMDYGASSAAWNATQSYGKPIIGHIVPSAAAATAALNKGATGLMVSGVQNVIPRSINPSQV